QPITRRILQEPPRRFAQRPSQSRIAAFGHAALLVSFPRTVFAGTQPQVRPHLPPVLEPRPVPHFPREDLLGQSANPLGIGCVLCASIFIVCTRTCSCNAKAAVRNGVNNSINHDGTGNAGQFRWPYHLPVNRQPYGNPSPRPRCTIIFKSRRRLWRIRLSLRRRSCASVGTRTKASACALPATYRSSAFNIARASVRSVLTRWCWSSQFRGRIT